MEPKQSIIMPYHRNKEMLYYTTQLLDKIIPNEVEIIIVGNNNNLNELKSDLHILNMINQCCIQKQQI